MPGLWEHWTQDGDTPGIDPFVFGAALRELARGSVSKAEIVAAFGLDATAEGELDAIIAHYGGLLVTEQDDYRVKLQDVMILSKAKLYSKAKAKSELGF